MPVERRTSTRQTLTLVISVLAIVGAVVLVIAAVQAAGRANSATIGGGQTEIDAGLAKERAASIDRDGPLLFSDVSGGGQRLPIYLSHTGDDPETGWHVLDAHPPDTPEDCFVQWPKGGTRFETTCNDDTFPRDGGTLHKFSWRVTDDGRLLVDLRKPAA